MYKLFQNEGTITEKTILQISTPNLTASPWILNLTHIFRDLKSGKGPKSYKAL